MSAPSHAVDDEVQLKLQSPEPQLISDGLHESSPLHVTVRSVASEPSMVASTQAALPLHMTVHEYPERQDNVYPPLQ